MKCKQKYAFSSLIMGLALLISSASVFSQTIIGNYDFNSGSSYTTLSPTLAANITCFVSSTEAWQTYIGISSGSNAFMANTEAGSALAMANSSGTNSRYFQFQLGGLDLATYQSYKIYLQAQRSTTGASTITIAYSTDGSTFTNFATTQQSGNGAFSECQFDLSSISALNLKSNIYFRVLVSGASGTGTLRIDNFQIRATQQICNLPSKLLFNVQPISSSQNNVINAVSVAVACNSGVIATSCNNGNVTLSFSGTGISGTMSMPVINGVATFTNLSVNTVQNNVSFTSSYSGSCGSLTQSTSNTFSVLPLKNENFDGSAPSWSYTIGTPTSFDNGGITGADVTGLKTFGSPNNNSLCKSYSIDNLSGDIGSLNTITFNNVTGLSVYDQVQFSFQIASLGSGSGSGTDVNEYLQLQTSIDGGSTWNNLIRNTGNNDHLFPLSSIAPVNLTLNANATYSIGNLLWNQSAFFVNLPIGTSQFSFRMIAADNRTNENWAIDNIVLKNIPISISAGSNQTITCTTPSVALTSSASVSGLNYLWTGPANGSMAGSTPTASTTIVSTAGIYTLTVTHPINNSSASSTVQVTLNNTAPNVSAGSNQTITASNPSVTLTGSSTTSGVTYSWTPGGSTPANSTTNVSYGDIYTLRITNPNNGCIATATVAVVDKFKKVITAIKHNNCIGSNGSITCYIKGGGTTYSYAWQPDGTTNNSITNKEIGNYSVTISGSGETPVNLSFFIGYKAKWQNLSGTSDLNDTLKQNRTDAGNTWETGATGINVLKANENGWVEYVVSYPYKNKIIGLSKTINSQTNYTDIDYGIYLNSNGILYTSNNGNQTPLVSYVEGDVLLIKRFNDTLSYLKNGTTIWTTSISNDLLQINWNLKASIFDYGAYFGNVGCSFSSFSINDVVTQDINCVSNTNGTARVDLIGGVSPYRYKWDGGASVNSNTLISVNKGTHTVQVTDNNLCELTQTYTISNCPIWSNQIGAITINNNGDVIKSGGADNWEGTQLTTSEPFILAEIPFWISFKTPDTLSVFMLGFRSIDLDSTAQTTNYKLFIENSIATVLETDNDGFYNKRQIKLVTKNMGFKVQLTKEGIEYYVRNNSTSPYVLTYVSKLFSTAKVIIESNLYKTGSRINAIRVSDYGNTSAPSTE